ncbi:MULTISPECIES: PQQ-binding-like beta-propeller repeat protein [unclassified Streptomyces]|uniref:outer membrane protein assembly factor BamB family protein n=1 Tax=unclassified Streptomyces TaxID=2593676 RepID=UPI00336AE40A
MEPRPRVGPYRVIAGHDWDADHTRYCLALGLQAPCHAVVLAVPPAALADDTAFRVRFRSEAENSRRLAGPAVLPVVDVAPDGPGLPWAASAYLPALPLPQALAAAGGPLPEPTVRALGAALAATLAAAHAGGLVHTGISPATVLLAADGPRLLGYGAARASASDRQPPGRAAVSVPPEQRTGGWPQPPGDVFALGTVLAYAATGRTHPRPDAIPAALRRAITAAYAPDPGLRPRAADLAAELGPPPAPGWLPSPVTAAIDRQEAAVRAAEAEARAEAAAAEPPTVTPGPAAPATARRTLLVGAAAATVGLALGGVAAFAASGGKETARPRPRRTRLPGVAPKPLWRAELPARVSDRAKGSPPLIWRDRIVVHAAGRGVVGIDLRTGDRLWTLDDHPVRGEMYDLGGGLVLVPGDTFKAVSARTGTVTWSAADYAPGRALAFATPLALSGDTFWFTASRKGAKGAEDGRSWGRVVAYDTKAREERWSVPFGAPGKGGALLQRDFLLLSEADGRYTAVDRRHGRKLWTQKYRGVPGDQEPPVHTSTPDGLLVVTLAGKLRAFEMRGGEQAWAFGSDTGLFGRALRHGPHLYVTDTLARTYALDAADGALKWERDNGVSVRTSLPYPVTSVSGSGRTVLASTASSVDAYAADNGTLLWRFTAVGEGREKGFTGAVVACGAGVALVRNDRVLYALPVD